MGAILYQNVTGLTIHGAISSYTYFQWVKHVGLDLENVFNNIQLVHCEQ